MPEVGAVIEVLLNPGGRRDAQRRLQRRWYRWTGEGWKTLGSRVEALGKLEAFEACKRRAPSTLARYSPSDTR